MAAMKLNQNTIPDVSLIDGNNVIALPLANREITRSPMVTAFEIGFGQVEFTFPPEMDNAFARIDAMHRLIEAAKAEAQKMEEANLDAFRLAVNEEKSRTKSETSNYSPHRHKGPTHLTLLTLGLTIGLTFFLTLGLTLGVAKVTPAKEQMAQQTVERWVNDMVYALSR